jgi:glucan phosphoethanolaminetransferase (alkaline phosphatase superfamily)
MEFDVAAPWWWTPAAVLTGLVAIVYMWVRYSRQYQGIKRVLVRLFGIVAGIALPILVHGQNSNYIHVRGDELHVRGRFGQSPRNYALADVLSFGFERQGGATSRSTRYTALVVLFRDGSTAEVSEHMMNYERLKAHLDNAGISRR